MSFEHVTLAMDLSLSQPGFAVLAITDGKPIVLETSVVKTDAKKSHGERLEDIDSELEGYLWGYKPTHIVREKGFSRFPAVTQTLFKVVGVTDLVIAFYTGCFDEAPKEAHEIPVTSVKKLVTGNGKATKEDVAEAVFRRLQIENTDEYYTKSGKLIDDKTDAMAVGLAYYIEKGLIE